MNENQEVSVENATGGTFTLSYEGSAPTKAIKYPEGSETEVKEALEEIPALVGNVEVERFVKGLFSVTFIGALGATDVPPLEADPSGLEGSGSQEVAVKERANGFDGHLGEGVLGKATGVAAYTYTDAEESTRRLYLAVADAEADELKLFSGPTAATELKLRRTISGVDADKDPGTPDQQFEFGASGAYLTADPGNEGAAPGRKCTQVEVSGQKQACTAGHLFLYDAGHGVVDELDAHGDFLDQLTAAGLQDAEPTQVAVQRSGKEGDGTVYVSSGASAGAKLYAFGPLTLPGRKLDEARSHVLEKAAAVAVDPYGYLYVAAQKNIHVYSPAGAPVVEFETPGAAGDLALDSACHVYEVESGTPALTYYKPSQCPPTPATTFARHEPNLVPAGPITGLGIQAVAVDPANDRAFLAISQSGQPGVVEFGSTEEGSPILDECDAGLGPFTGFFDIDVNAATGEIYYAGGFGHIYASTCGAEPELLRDVKGGGCPSGEIFASAAIAIDQSDGHLLEYANIGLEGETAREYEGVGGCVAEFGSFKPTTGGYRVAIDNSCAIHDPPLVGAACESFDPAYGTAYVAFDSTNKEQKYDVSAFGPLEYLEVTPPKEFELTIATAGTGTVECEVEEGPAEACAPAYLEGTKLSLVASADPGSEFTGFSGDCAGLTCDLVMDQPRSVTATFDEEAPPTPEFPLTIALEGTGSGIVESDPGLISCEPFCKDEFEEGAEVTLTASPQAGSLFMAWKHCDAGAVNGRRCTVTMSKAKEVSAVFITAHDLTLAKAEGSGPGKLQSKPGGVVCLYACTAETSAFKEGTTVAVNATPAKHFHLAGFSGDCTGTGPCELTMGEDHEVKALFEEDPKLSLSLFKTGGGQALIKTKPAGFVCGYTCTDAEASLYEGEDVEVKWKLGKGTTSIEWAKGAGGCTGTSEAVEGSCTLTLDAAKELVAQLE